MLKVVHPGLLTTLQDRGRTGSAHLGIGHSGAADVPALRLANALAGNPDDACALEITLKGPVLQTDQDLWIAVTGAPLPHARIDDAALPMWQPVHVAAGSRLDLGSMAQGCRSYLAVAGGIDVPTWRGSRATDVNAALGPVPHPLEADDTLPVGHSRIDPPAETSWSLDPRHWFDTANPARVRLLPGSHHQTLDGLSRAALTKATLRVGTDSNRVGLRLDGPSLHLSESPELVSTGIVAGTMQLPPDGRAIIMGPEHPVTGGYPRIAQVAAVDLPILAQCRPGATVGFQWITMERATMMQVEQELVLEHLLAEIRQRLEEA